MAPKSSTIALFLTFNILFFTLTAATYSNCPPPPHHKPKPKPRPTPTPTPTPSTPSGSGKCPRDALKIGVCANALNLVNIKLGAPPVKPCCSLIQGLVDLEAAVCLCTALKLSVLGINLNVPIDLSVLLNVCGKKAPRGFQCP